MKTVIVAVVALLLVLSLVVPAFAHAVLLGSDPEAGEMLPMTEQVSLTFNEEINPEFVTVVVEGPDGDVAAGAPEVEGTVVTQEISPTSSGEHLIIYRVVSQDGHPVDGELTFILTDVPAPVPTQTPEPTAAETATETQTPETTETPAEATATPEVELIDSGPGWPLGVLATVGIVLVALIAGGAVFWNSRRDSD